MEERNISKHDEYANSKDDMVSDFNFEIPSSNRTCAHPCGLACSQSFYYLSASVSTFLAGATSLLTYYSLDSVYIEMQPF